MSSKWVFMAVLALIVLVRTTEPTLAEQEIIRGSPVPCDPRLMEGRRKLDSINVLDERCKTAVKEFSPYRENRITLEKFDWGHVYLLDSPDRLVAKYVVFDILGLPFKAAVICAQWPNGNTLAAISSNEKPLYCGELTWTPNCEIFDRLRRLSDNAKYRNETERTWAELKCIARVRRESVGSSIALGDPRVDAVGRMIIQQNLAAREAACQQNR
jgi:hypothetical protein